MLHCAAIDQRIIALVVLLRDRAIKIVDYLCILVGGVIERRDATST